MALEIN